MGRGHPHPEGKALQLGISTLMFLLHFYVLRMAIKSAVKAKHAACSLLLIMRGDRCYLLFP